MRADELPPTSWSPDALVRAECRGVSECYRRFGRPLHARGWLAPRQSGRNPKTCSPWRDAPPALRCRRRPAVALDTDGSWSYRTSSRQASGANLGPCRGSRYSRPHQGFAYPDAFRARPETAVRHRSGASDPGDDCEELDSRPQDTRCAGATPHPRTLRCSSAWSSSPSRLPSAELEYVSDRDAGFKQPLERCKLLTRWAFEYFDQTG